MNKNLIKHVAVGASLLAIMAPVAALAQVNLGFDIAANASDLTTRDVRETVSTIINAFMGLLGLVAVVLILLGGFKWMMAQGNEEKIDDAKKLMMSGVIGLIIIMSAYAIAQFVINAILQGTSG
jgi:cytochrome bd-type quinol oxidase subunit 2